MLARRAYSVAELRRALERRFGAVGDRSSTRPVSDALARLRQLGFLDDRKFAARYAASLAEKRAFGRHRIRRELKAKLVDYRTIEPALRLTFEETDEQELLERVLEKKVRALRLPLTPRKLSSLCMSLLRHGFNSGDIMKAVRSRPELRPVADDVDLTGLESGGLDSE